MISMRNNVLILSLLLNGYLLFLGNSSEKKEHSNSRESISKRTIGSTSAEVVDVGSGDFSSHEKDLSKSRESEFHQSETIGSKSELDKEALLNEHTDLLKSLCLAGDRCYRYFNEISNRYHQTNDPALKRELELATNDMLAEMCSKKVDRSDPQKGEHFYYCGNDILGSLNGDQIKAFQRGCELKNTGACYTLTQQMPSLDETTKSRYLTDACRDQIGSACLELADHLSGPQRQEVLEKACQQDMSEACLLIVKENQEIDLSVVTNLKKSCLTHSPASCDLLTDHVLISPLEQLQVHQQRCFNLFDLEACKKLLNLFDPKTSGAIGVSAKGICDTLNERLPSSFITTDSEGKKVENLPVCYGFSSYSSCPTTEARTEIEQGCPSFS